MTNLNATIDRYQSVRITAFAAGSYTILKEVITDHRLNDKKRTWFRVDASREDLERLPTHKLMVVTKHYTKLSTLCKNLGIDPAKAAHAIL